MADKPKGPKGPARPDDGNGIADMIRELKETLARFPDATAGAFANSFSRVMGEFRRPAADGVTTPGPGISSAGSAFDAKAAFRSVAAALAPMAKWMARADRGVAGPTPGPRFSPPQRDFGKIDWSSILSERRADIPAGPGGSLFGSKYFGSGDVMADVRKRRREQDALRASYNHGLGGGYKPYSHAAHLAATFAGKTTVGRGFPGMSPAAGAAGAFGPAAGPAPPSGASSRFWADLSASWRSMAANFRFFTNHPGAAIGGVGASFAASGFAQRLGRADAAFHSFRAAPFLNTYRGAAGAGRAAFAAANAMTRRARVVHRRANRAYQQAGGGHAGRGAYAAAFAGPKYGAMVGRAVTGMSMAAGIAGTVASAVLTAIEKGRVFAEDRNKNNRRYSGTNGGIALSFAQLDRGEMFREMRTGRENESSIMRLTNAVNQMREAYRPSESLATAAGNRGGIVGAESAASFMRLFNPVIEGARKAIEGADPGGVATQAAVQSVWRNVHGGVAAVANGFANVATLGLWPAKGGGNPLQAFNQAWEAELQAQLAQNTGHDAWAANLRHLANLKPFIPPKRIRMP